MFSDLTSLILHIRGTRDLLVPQHQARVRRPQRVQRGDAPQQLTQVQLPASLRPRRLGPVPQLGLVLPQLDPRQLPRRQVVTFVEADVIRVQGVEMPGGGVEGEAGRGAAVPVHNGGMVLGEGDGAEHLLVLNCVHTNSVKIVALDLHVRASEQDDSLIVQFLGDEVHQLHVGRCDPLGLHGIPQQVAGGLAPILLVLLADLQRELLHFFEKVVIVVFVRSLGRVKEH